MTTVEAGVAIGQPYPKHEERATAIHEAGHAVCGHLYMENRLSTRLSIRKRGSSGGHHQAMEIEDRFGHWRSEQVGDLIWTPRRDGRRARLLRPEHDRRRRRPRLGDRAGRAHGRLPRHGARRRSTSPTGSRTPRRARRPSERAMERFERLGYQLMHRSGGGVMDDEPVRARRSATATSGGSSPGCSARRSWSPGTPCGSTARARSTWPSG